MKYLAAFIFTCALCIGQFSHTIAAPQDGQNTKDIIIFRILGMIDEYAGRVIVEDGDHIEHFFCNEHDQSLIFGEYLKMLATEMKINTVVQERIVQECLADLYSHELNEIINSYYKYKFNTKSSNEKDTASAFISKDIFQEDDTKSRLAYLSGAYLRYGDGNSLTIYNARHKADLLVDLLKEVGCTDVVLDSLDTIPVTSNISFHPTDETKEWFTDVPMISGSHVEYYDGGAVFREMNYEDSKLEGIFKEYYESGKILKELGYEAGDLRYSKIYYENGNLYKDGYVKDGNLDGISRRYYETGEIEFEWTFKDGVLEGSAREFHKNDAIRATMNYVNDKREGSHKVYYEDGSIKNEYSYQNDEVVSEKSYDKEGNLIPSEDK